MALSEEELQKVRVVLSTSGWNDVMRPKILSRGNSALKALALSRAERAAEWKGSDFDTDDDVLRAIIRDCTWMIGVWTNELAVAEHNRRLDELDSQADGAANPR